MAKKVIASGTIYDGNQKAIDKIIKEANRELIKLQMPPLEVRLGKSWGEEMTLGSPSPRKIRCWNFIVRGSLPTPKGTMIHGIIESTGKSDTNRVSNFAKDRKVSYRDLAKSPIECCECQGKSRDKGYIISKGEEAPQTIGENCLEKLIGFRPDKAIKLMSLYQDVERSVYTIKGDKGLTSKITDDTYLSLQEFVQHTLCAVDKKGYVTQKDGAMPTGKSAMLAYLNGPQLAYTGSMFNQLWGNYENYQNIYEESRGEAEKIIAWAKSLPEDSNSSYLNNLRKIANDQWVAIKHTNLAASMYHAYQSRQYDASQRAEKSSTTPSEGLHGLHLKCASVRQVKTKYGERYLHELYDSEGQAFGLFSKEKSMTPGKFYNIISEFNSGDNAKKMSSNLTILRNIQKIESTTLDSPSPIPSSKDNDGGCRP